MLCKFKSVCFLLLSLLLCTLMTSNSGYSQEISINQNIKNILESNWKKPEFKENNYAVLSLTARKKSYMNYAEVMSSSGNDIFNDSVLEAYGSAKELIFLPENEKKDEKGFSFLFYCSGESNQNFACQIYDFSQYFENLNNKIDFNIKYMIFNEPAFAAINLDVHKKGNLLGKQIVSSSGSSEFNNRVLKYIDQSAPFEPLPVLLPFDKISIGTRFIKNQEYVDISAFMKNVNKKIMKNWKCFMGSGSENAIVFFRIDRSGKLLENKIIDSSGNVEYNNAALKAVENSAPFEGYPITRPYEFADIEFTFSKNNSSNIFAKYTKEQQSQIKDYIQLQRKKVNANFDFQKNIFDLSLKTVVIQFTIDKNGKFIGNLSLPKSSKNQKFNDAVIDAVKNTRFDPMPGFMNEEALILNLGFGSGPSPFYNYLSIFMIVLSGLI